MPKKWLQENKLFEFSQKKFPVFFLDILEKTISESCGNDALVFLIISGFTGKRYAKTKGACTILDIWKTRFQENFVVSILENLFAAKIENKTCI